MTEPARKRPPATRARASLGVTASVLLILGALGYTYFLPRIWRQDGPSMLPTLGDGARLLSLDSTPTLGDVVVVATSDGITTAKRVVGLPGDTIAFASGVLVRNGHAVTEVGRAARSTDGVPRSCHREHLGVHAYEVLTDDDGFPPTTTPVHVPPHTVYVLGDNRDRSNDSRFFGPVPLRRVLGRVASEWGSTPRPIHCRR